MQAGGDGQVEIGNPVHRGVLDAPVKDGIDDAPGGLDGDPFPAAVPTRIYQVGPGLGLLETLEQFLGIARGVQHEEGGPKAC